MSRNKAAGCDKIVADVFLNAKQFITPYLVKIFNKIYEDGIYPVSWTKKIIVSIHKKGDKADPSNNRGISLISTMAMIFFIYIKKQAR